MTVRNRLSNLFGRGSNPLPSQLPLTLPDPEPLLIDPILPPADLDLLVTMWPSYPFFGSFAQDPRLAGVRLNSAMLPLDKLTEELALVEQLQSTRPMFFDVKGRQLRVAEVHTQPDVNRLELSLNHPISLDPSSIRGLPVLFKAGNDFSVLESIEDDGQRLVFLTGDEFVPHYQVRVGESLHIKHPSLQVHGPQFTEFELAKIDLVLKAGYRQFFLSYVESAADVDQFREIVGRDAFVYLKIENGKGLQYVREEFVKEDQLALVAARGDLYVEMERPHQIVAATKMIIDKDPQACVASRILLSIVGPAPEYRAKVPECTDFSELAWLHSLGYRTMMLCDEICRKEQFIRTAVNAFDAFRQSLEIDTAAAEQSAAVFFF